MASTVLHFSDPKMYPIIDKNVIKAMKKLGWKTRVLMKINQGTVDFYKYYVGKVQSLNEEGNVRDIANKFGVTPIRLIEAAMYSRGKGWTTD